MAADPTPSAGDENGHSKGRDYAEETLARIRYRDEICWFNAPVPDDTMRQQSAWILLPNACLFRTISFRTVQTATLPAGWPADLQHLGAKAARRTWGTRSSLRHLFLMQKQNPGIRRF
ncbi:uncharacterized protein ATNIH1004_002055 [Aspergillus tanneri]|uniref:Uncharacterized protein n=1 Tax=Aspergillus tanneri TaxID=1220188 RepID=A0A5M9M2W0_9EURO|nr:uncharacterized protein ATNIH1004_002055 [Aspergillus tanneri]KAA8641315.1 hypothetical protein ATNIH1004_002055 [Aspergillus tanneri]